MYSVPEIMYNKRIQYQKLSIWKFGQRLDFDRIEGNSYLNLLLTRYTQNTVSLNNPPTSKACC